MHNTVCACLCSINLWVHTSLYAYICVCVSFPSSSVTSPGQGIFFLFLTTSWQPTSTYSHGQGQSGCLLVSTLVGKGRTLGRAVVGQALPHRVPFVSSTALPPRTVHPLASVLPQEWSWMLPTALQPRRISQVPPSGPWTLGWRWAWRWQLPATAQVTRRWVWQPWAGMCRRRSAGHNRSATQSTQSPSPLQALGRISSLSLPASGGCWYS